MSVKIVSRSSTNARATSGTSDFLNGNVGDWQTTTITVTVACDFKTSLSAQVTVNTDDTWTLSSGNWSDYGFEVGDAITGTLNQTNNSTGTNTDTAISVNVVSIVGNIMEVDGAIFGTIPLSFIVPSSTFGYTLNWMEIIVDKSWNAFKFEYNQILNSQVGSPTLASELDGSFTSFVASSTGAMTPVLPQSGNAVYSVTTTFISKVSGVSTYEIDVIHNIAGVYDITTDISGNNRPIWWVGADCFTDIYRVTFYPTAGSPVGALSSSLTDVVANVTGNTGWFNEDRNGGSDIFTVTSVSYEDTLANSLTSLASDDETVVTIEISSSSPFFDTTNSNFIFGIFGYLPIDRSSLANNSKNALGVLCANTMGVDQTYTHSASPTVGTISGFPNDAGAEIEIESYQFEVNSSTSLTVTINVRPNAAFTTMINAAASGDRMFAMWVGLAEESTAYTPAVRVNKLITAQWSPEVVEPESLKGGSLFTLYPRENDYYTTPGITSVSDIIEEDDFHMAMEFVLDEDARISTAEYGIEVVNPSNGVTFNLERNVYDLSTQPVSAFGIQEINFTTNRPFNYIDGFKDKLVSLTRKSSLDSGRNVGFAFIHPFRFRYEWWLSNPLMALFYNSSLPLDNLNYNWYTKQSGLFSSVQIRAYQLLLIDGVEYKDWKNLDIYSYRDAYRVEAGFDGSIGVYSDDLYANSLNIGTKDNYLLCDLFAFDDDNPNYVKAELTRASTVFSTDYAEITLEAEDGSGYLSQWKLRSDQTPEANNPIRPLDGETTIKVTDATGSVTSECYVDCSLLPSNIVNLKLTAEFVGSASEGSGESEYYNRDMIFGVIGRASTPDPDQYCTIDEPCGYELPVFASTESTDYYKNDIKGIFKKKSVLESDIEFFLVDDDGNEYALNDGTYGTFFDFESFTYEPDLIAYQLEWRNVLSSLGEGCYRIKTVVTDLASNETANYSCCYNLQTYDCQSAHRTVRIESVQNGYFQDLDINFKGINWVDHLRFEGYFGYEQPKHDSTVNIKTNNTKELNRMDLRSEFKLTSSLVPSICVTHPLWNYHLMASLLYVSDYNLDNHRRDYISFPVFFEEVDDVTYFKMNTKAKMSLSFSERQTKKRVSTCDGERPNDPYDPNHIYTGGGVTPKELTIAIPYSASDDTSTVTIIANAVGTITAANTTGLTSVVFTVNAGTVTLPFALALSDVLEITYDAAASGGTIILTGTYV